MSTFIHPHASAEAVKFAFKRANWEHLNEQITKSPFDPYCYSNVNVLVQERYKWINKILEANIPKFTRHRDSFPPWVTPSTSHLINKMETKKKRWQIMNLSRSLKIKKIEKQISIEMEKDQSNFESEVFAGRRFSNIQKYLWAIRKSPSMPPIVNYANTSARTHQHKAELFNSFFQKVYINKVDYKPAVLRRKPHSLHITEKLKTNILSKLQLNKSNGPDNFGNIIFKFCSATLSKSLVLFFKQCPIKENSLLSGK